MSYEYSTEEAKKGGPTHPDEWQSLSLREAGVSLIDCEHRTPPPSEIGFPYIAIPQLKEGRIDLTDVRLITPANFQEWTRKANPQPFDVILSRRCNPGETASVPSGLVCAIGQNLVLLRADGKKVSPKFLRWLVRGPGWWEQVRRFINVGAVFESLKCADIPNFRLLIPPLPEQTAISQVLGTLDDKIELNLQMNRTLEAMGKAIFKHWFISFEFPNEQGKFYKSSGGEMTYSEELGKEIPKGWKVGNILDCAEILSGGTPRTEVAKYWGGAVPWVTAKDVTNSQGSYILDTERTITQLGIENSNAKMIPKNTTVVTARGVVGSYCILSREMAINQTNYGLKAKPECGDFFVFFSVSNLVNQMNQHSYGTIFDTITTKTFDEMKIPLPSNSLIKSFEAKVAPTIARILLNLQESRSLVDIRDTLLPKLISARIRIPVEDA